MDKDKLSEGKWRNYSHLNTESLWIIPKRDNSGTHKGDYHGNFVPQVPRDLMQRFTEEGDWVLDVFAGSGTTLIEAKTLGRNALGFDVSEEARKITADRVSRTKSDFQVNVSVEDRDAADVSSYSDLHEKFQLAIVHPPYMDIVKFSENPLCVANRVFTGKGFSHDLSRFEELMSRVSLYLGDAIKPGGHIAVVIGDMYKDGEWINLGFKTWESFSSEFCLKATVIKNMEGNEKAKGIRKNLWRYRHLRNGTYEFKHEYIFIGKKR